MRTRFSLLVFFALATAFLVHAEVNLRAPIETMSLRDGRVLKNVKIVGFTEHAVSAKWDGGRGTINHADLPDDVMTAIANRAPAVASTAGPAVADFPSRPPEHLYGSIIEKENGMLIVRCRDPHRNQNRAVTKSAKSVGSIYIAPSEDDPIPYYTGTAAIRNHPDFPRVGVQDQVDLVAVRVGDYQKAGDYQRTTVLPMYRLQ